MSTPAPYDPGPLTARVRHVTESLIPTLYKRWTNSIPPDATAEVRREARAAAVDLVASERGIDPSVVDHMVRKHEEAPIMEAGCRLASWRGHYISRDIVEMAQEFGYLVDSSDEWLLDCYDEHCNDEGYPVETVYELAQAAEDWLNAGRDERQPGQNYPLAIPDDHYWGFNDGDFGLWPHEEDPS